MNYNKHLMLMGTDLIEVSQMGRYYYSPLQRKGQRFFEEYIPLDRVFDEAFDPDFSYIINDPTPYAPEPELDPERILVYEGLRKLTATPVGRGLLIGAYALSYLPLAEPGPPAKKYEPGELMFIQSGVGGGMIV